MCIEHGTDRKASRIQVRISTSCRGGGRSAWAAALLPQMTVGGPVPSHPAYEGSPQPRGQGLPIPTDAEEGAANARSGAA